MLPVSASPTLHVSPSVRRIRWPQITLSFVVASVVVCLILLPNFVALPLWGWSPYFQLGRIVTGDEPHYLLIITSVVEDGDLDLSNNYQDVHAGKSWGAGQKFHDMRRLDHHTHFLIDARPVLWDSNYQSFHDEATLKPDAKDSYGRFYPEPKAAKSAIPPGTPEYSFHPSGIGYLVAPFAIWFRGTPYLETVALLCSSLATIIAYLFFRKLLEHCGSSGQVVEAIAAVAFLGTSAWFYSRALFTESYLLMCVAATYSLAIRRQNPLLAGMFVAIAIQLKAYYLIAVIPLGIDMLVRKDRRYAALYSIPIFLGGLLFFLQNKAFNGGYLTGSPPFLMGSFRAGTKGMLTSWSNGLLLVSPVVLVPLFAWPTFIRRFPREALLLGAAFWCNFVLVAHYRNWAGGQCYGPRLITPFVPFIFVSLVACPEWIRLRSWKGVVFWSLAALSIFGNALAAFDREGYWSGVPLWRLWHWAQQVISG
jgi:hypothetical protein